MSWLGGLLKFYAYVFHLALSGFLLAIAVLARKSHQPLHMEMLPFDQSRMISRVSMLSLLGLICLFLALVRIFEFVFPLWSLAVIVLLIWGFFFTPYSFQGLGGLAWCLAFIGAAAVAFCGSILVLLPQRKNRW